MAEGKGIGIEAGIKEQQTRMLCKFESGDDLLSVPRARDMARVCDVRGPGTLLEPSRRVPADRPARVENVWDLLRLVQD